MIMKRLLAYFGVVLLACGCGLDEPVLSGAGGSQIEFSASKMRVITKAGDSAEPFAEGTNFRLFGVQNVGNVSDWSAAGVKFHDVEGIGSASGKVDYSIDGKKASYDVGRNLDFYGLTYGTSSKVPITGDAGSAPTVSLSLTGGSFPDLMYSDNLKNKNSSSGLLQMEFRHTLSKLKFEVLKQDETADDDKKLTNVLLQKVVLKGSAASAVFNAKSGEWSYETYSVQDRVVYEPATGLKITESAQMLKSGEDDIEMLVVPNTGQLTLEVTLDMDGNPDATDDKTVAYNLMASESEFLKLEQNHEYTFSIVILKNDVRIVTVTPKVYEWIDVELDTGDAYFGQPVYFGGLMWMDRNLGAKSADCENDWYNSIGYYYQFGRNVPFILDVKAYLASFSSLNGFSFRLSQGAKGDPDAIYEMRAIYTLNDKGEKVTTAKYADRRDGTCLYDHVAINPGETDKEYSYIMGLTTESTPKTWAITGFNNIDDRKNENHIYWQNGDILNVNNQPCPKGWRLPTKEDLYSFMPEDNKLLWSQVYIQGEDMRSPVVVGETTMASKYKHSEDVNNKGKWNYKWSYFSGKFDIDTDIDKDTEFSYPVKNAVFARVFGIKYVGEQKAYRVMFEQRASVDGKRTYVRIYRFDTNASDEFKVSDDGTQWNLHKFDWTTPAEYMDIPLSGFMHNGGFTQFGTDAILRASTPSTTRGWNWTLYFRSGSNGVCVTDNTRRNLGEIIRCVRDINANK